MCDAAVWRLNPTCTEHYCQYHLEICFKPETERYIRRRGGGREQGGGREEGRVREERVGDEGGVRGRRKEGKGRWRREERVKKEGKWRKGEGKKEGRRREV